MESTIKIIIDKVNVFQGFIVWSLIFAFLHTLLSPSNRSVVAYFIAAVVCVPVGILSGMIASELGYSEGVTYAIVSVSALLAQDIIKFILSVNGFISDRKDTLIENTFSYVTSKAQKYIDRRLDEDTHNKDKEDS